MLTKFLRAAAGAKRGLVFVGGFASTQAQASTPSISLTSLTGGISSAPAAGDIVIACISTNDNADINITCTTSGYTEIADLYANDTNDSQLAVYYKVLSSAETTVGFNVGDTQDTNMVVHVWRNINATPLDTTSTTATIINTGVPNPPSITTVTPNAVVIAVGAAAYGSFAAQGASFTVPSGMENFFQARISSSESGIGIASVVVASPGAYDPAAFGGGVVNSANSACAVTIALRPA